MALQSLVSFLALSGLSTAALLPRIDTVEASTNNVTITSLTKSVNATGGSGNVAAAGTLSPFGNIGVGCGINWEEKKSYGGGLQAGSSDFGLGGGYTITPETLDIGMGIGIPVKNASADIDFKGHTNGSFTLTFSSSKGFACRPSVEGGKAVVVCETL